MAQRALIIGLGSTGYDVCDYIAKRIQWEQGGMERVPWLKFLILETEPPAGTGVLEENFVHLTIGSSDYEGLINNPGRYKDQLDLESWWDKDALLQLGDRALTKGAGNIRMVGRLSFLFPSLCNRIRNEIGARLDRLRSLTPQEAQTARGLLPDGSNPPLSLSDDIVVYVVGTLCGGTCSGAFIDLGYMLHYCFGSNGYKIQRRGLFSIPNLAYDPLSNQRRRANAFAALKELNHFMSGNQYSVQYPFNAGRPENPTRYSPFDTTYLSQPEGGDEKAFEKVKITTSQFLHNEVFNPAAAQLGARTVDGAASMFGGDKNGSPVTFYSFGMSALEVPGYLIAQGCCYKLGVEALDDFTAPRPNALQEADAFRIKTLSVSSEQIAQKLLRDPNGDPSGEGGVNILARLKDQVAAAVSGASNAGKQAAQDLAAAEERANLAFAARNGEAAPTSDREATSNLPPHLIPLRIDANVQTLENQYRTDIDREIQMALRDPARGPIWCDVILSETQKYLEERTKELSSGSHSENLERATKNARNALGAARSRVEACATDPFVALFLGRKRALERELASYGEAANAAYRRRLDAMLFAPEKMLCDKLLPIVRAMRTQISGAGSSDDTSVLAQARQLREILAGKLAKVDEVSPVLNGTSLFEANRTVEAKYTAFWNGRGPQAKSAAQHAFVQGWRRLPRVEAATSALTELGSYFVDGTATIASGENLTRQLRDVAETMARGFRPTFGPLLQESILDRPETGDPMLLRDVRAKSAVMLGLNRHSGLTQLTGNNEVDLVFFQGGKSAANQPGSKASEIHNALSSMRQNGVTMRFEESASPQELLFVRALGGFSLAMIHGFQPPELEGNNFRGSFEVENFEKFNVHSRTGIKWQPFDGDRDQKAEWRQGLLLTGMCLSRTGNMADCLVIKTENGLLYRPPRPLGPGRDKLLLPLDLREAAGVLREASGFEACLEDDIKRLRAARSLEELALCLEWLYQNSENLGLWRTESRFSLRYEGAESGQDSPSPQDQSAKQAAAQRAAATPITELLAFDLLKGYWRNDAAMMGRLTGIYTPDLLPAEAPTIAPFPGQNAAPPTSNSATSASPAPVAAPASPSGPVTPFPGQNSISTSAATTPFPTQNSATNAPVSAPDTSDWT